MDKQDIYNKLEGISGELECMLKDETIESFPSAFKTTRDNLDDLLNEIETSIEEDKAKEKEIE